MAAKNSKHHLLKNKKLLRLKKDTVIVVDEKGNAKITGSGKEKVVAE